MSLLAFDLLTVVVGAGTGLATGAAAGASADLASWAGVRSVKEVTRAVSAMLPATVAIKKPVCLSRPRKC